MEAVQERPLLSRESKTRLSIVGLSTRWTLTTKADFQDYLHWLLMSTGSDSCHKGFLDGRRSCGGLEISWCSGPVSSALAFTTSLSVAAFLRRAGGSMLARTGSKWSGVGRRVPEMRRVVEFNCASTTIHNTQRYRQIDRIGQERQRSNQFYKWSPKKNKKLNVRWWRNLCQILSHGLDHSTTPDPQSNRNANSSIEQYPQRSGSSRCKLIVWTCSYGPDANERTNSVAATHSDQSAFTGTYQKIHC